MIFDKPNTELLKLVAVCKDFPLSHGLYKGEPFLISVDMDLKRITRVAEAARERGKNALVFARPCQNEALKEMYQGRNIRLYRITDEEIQSAFSFPTLLAEPPIEPYITAEGRYIHDGVIRICRDARKVQRIKNGGSSTST